MFGGKGAQGLDHRVVAVLLKTLVGRMVVWFLEEELGLTWFVLELGPIEGGGELGFVQVAH